MISEGRSVAVVKILDFAFQNLGDARELLGAGVIAGLLHLQDGSRCHADRAGELIRADAARLAERFDAYRGFTSLTLSCLCVMLLLVSV